MSPLDGQRVSGPAASYAEDHCALRWPLAFHGVFWSLLIAVWLCLLGVTADPNLSFLIVPLGLGYVLSTGSTGLLVTWPTGIRVDADGIRIGGIHRAERHARGGHQTRPLPPPNRQRNEVFFCPWPAVRGIEVVTGRKELREVTRYGRDLGLRKGRVFAVGKLWAPFMTAALVVHVDLGSASVPQFRPPAERRDWLKFTYRNPFRPSPVWFAPTRHPDALRAALAQFREQVGDPRP